MSLLVLILRWSGRNPLLGSVLQTCAPVLGHGRQITSLFALVVRPPFFSFFPCLPSIRKNKLVSGPITKVGVGGTRSPFWGSPRPSLSVLVSVHMWVFLCTWNACFLSGSHLVQLLSEAKWSLLVADASQSDACYSKRWTS